MEGSVFWADLNGCGLEATYPWSHLQTLLGKPRLHAPPGLGGTECPTALEQRASFFRQLSAETNENVRGLTFALLPVWPPPCSNQALEISVKRDSQAGSGRQPLAPRRKLVPSQCHDGPSRAKRTTCRFTLGFEEKTQATWHIVVLGRQGSIMVSKSTERETEWFIFCGQRHT